MKKVTAFDENIYRRISRDEIDAILRYSSAKPMSDVELEAFAAMCASRTCSRKVILSPEQVAALVIRLNAGIEACIRTDEKGEALFFEDCLVLTSIAIDMSAGI